MSAKKQTTVKKAKSSRSQEHAKRKAAEAQSPSISPRIKAIIFGALALFFAVMIFVKGEMAWMAVRGFFFGVFGMGMFLVPAALGLLCVTAEKGREVAHLKSKAFLCGMIILLAGAILYIIGGAKFNTDGHNFFSCLGNLYLQTSDTSQYMVFGCGLIGGILGYPLTFFCGSTASMILCFILIAAAVFVVANLSVRTFTDAASRKMSHVRERNAERMEAKRRQREERRRRQYDDGFDSGSAIDIPIYDGSDDRIDIPLDEPKKKPRKGKTKKSELDYEDTDNTNAVDVDLSDDLINVIRRAGKPMGAESDSTVEDIADDISREKRSRRRSKGAKQDDPETVPVEGSEVNEELEKASYDPEGEKQAEREYRFPPTQLLSPNTSNDDRSAMEEMQNKSRKLIETLNNFGVNAKIINICRGPAVTRYELQPAPGVKISKITNLADDIALALAADGVRIEAPIPGKAAVGIEVPNKVRSMVTMRELLESDEFKNGKSKLTAALGRDITGEIVVTDISEMPHLLIAGTTGSGKSVCVNAILISILYKATPDEVKLLLIDPKMVEFSKYKGIPHLIVPVVTDAKKAAGALGWAVNEMLNRYKIFSEYDVKNIETYNELIESNLAYMEQNPPVENEDGELVQPVLEVNGLPVAKEKMSRMVIAIDELADLMMAAPTEVEDSICRLAQMARAAGMHLILATQRPTVNVITGLIKANVPSRIALKVRSNMDSRTILDAGGGEKLIGKGDMLFAPVGAPKPMRVQCGFSSDSDIEAVTSYIKKSYGAQYNAEIEETIKRIAAEEIAAGKKAADSSDDDGLDIDAKMEEAIKCVIDAGQASTSLIQRRLKVGYARAGRMIDDMEQLGIVGPHQGSKPREVLMTYNEWLERRNVLQNNSD